MKAAVDAAMYAVVLLALGVLAVAVIAAVLYGIGALWVLVMT